jgi:hypothetical protein
MPTTRLDSPSGDVLRGLVIANQKGHCGLGVSDVGATQVKGLVQNADTF